MSNQELAGSSSIYLGSELEWNGRTCNFITDKLGYISLSLPSNSWRKQICGNLTKPTTKEGNIYEYYVLVDNTKIVSLPSYIHKPFLLKVESFHVKMSSYPSKDDQKF